MSMLYFWMKLVQYDEYLFHKTMESMDADALEL